MNRFLVLVGIAAIAGAMYVAAASGSQQSRGPTEKQFLALKKQVSALQKKVNTTQTLTNGVAGALLNCVLDQVVPTDQLGDTNGTGLFGYSFTAANGGGTTLTSAFDFAPAPAFADWLLPGVPSQDAACMSLVGHVDGTERRHNAAYTHAALRNFVTAYARTH